MIEAGTRVVFRARLVPLLTDRHLTIILELMMVLARGGALLICLLFAASASFKISLRTLHLSQCVWLIIEAGTRVVFRARLVSLLTYWHLTFILKLVMVLARRRALLITLLFAASTPLKISFRILYPCQNVWLIIKAGTWIIFRARFVSLLADRHLAIIRELKMILTRSRALFIRLFFTTSASLEISFRTPNLCQDILLMIIAGTRVVFEARLVSFLSNWHLAIVFFLEIVLARSRVLFKILIFSPCTSFKVNLRARNLNYWISMLNLICAGAWMVIFNLLISFFMDCKLPHIIAKLVLYDISTWAWMFTLSQVFSFCWKSKIIRLWLWFSDRETPFMIVVTWWRVIVWNRLIIFLSNSHFARIFTKVGVILVISRPDIRLNMLIWTTSLVDKVNFNTLWSDDRIGFFDTVVAGTYWLIRWC